jgi:hypothetical protein
MRRKPMPNSVFAVAQEQGPGEKRRSDDRGIFFWGAAGGQLASTKLKQ